MNLILFLIIVPILVENLTELFVKSSIFFPVRQVIHELNIELISDLIKCGYCFSFWVSLVLNSVLFLSLEDYISIIPNKLLNFIIIVLVIHRLSNIVHGAIDRYFDTRKDIRYNNRE